LVLVGDHLNGRRHRRGLATEWKYSHEKRFAVNAIVDTVEQQPATAAPISPEDIELPPTTSVSVTW